VNSLNPLRILRVPLDLAAQARDMIVYCPGRGKCSIAPYHIEEPFPRDWLTLSLCQESQHPEFLGREVQRFFASRCDLPAQVNLHLAQ